MERKYGKYVSAIVLILTTHLSASLLADDRRQAYIGIHGGPEKNGDLDLVGFRLAILFDRFQQNLNSDNKILRFFSRPEVSTLLDVTISKTSASYFVQNRYDFAIVPKLRYYFSEKGFLSGGLGIAYNDAEEENFPGSELTLGGHTFFAPEFSIGMDIGQNTRKGFLELNFAHRSNAGLRDVNHSLNYFLLSFGIRI